MRMQVFIATAIVVLLNVARARCPFDETRETGWYVQTWTKDLKDCETHGPFTYSDEAITFSDRQTDSGLRSSGAFYHINKERIERDDVGTKGTKLTFPDGDENVWLEFKQDGDRFYLWVINKGLPRYYYDSRANAGDAGDMSKQKFSLHSSSKGDKYVAVRYGRNDDLFLLVHVSPKKVGSDRWEVDADFADGLGKYGCGRDGLTSLIRWFGEDDRVEIRFGLKKSFACKIEYKYDHEQRRFYNPEDLDKPIHALLIPKVGPAGNGFQQWVLRDLGGGTFAIQNAFSKRLLDYVEEPRPGEVGKTILRAALFIWPKPPNKFQRWRIEDTGSGEKMIINDATGLALDYEFPDPKDPNGTIRTYLEKKDPSNIHQRWQLTYHGTSCVIRNTATGRVLDF